MKLTIYDLDNGALILRAGRWQHCYDDSLAYERLAADLIAAWKYGNTRDWDGHDPDARPAPWMKAYDANSPVLLGDLWASGSCAARALADELSTLMRQLGDRLV